MHVQEGPPNTRLLFAYSKGDLPPDATCAQLASFLHRVMKPWEDTVPDIERGLEYALSSDPGRGGFVVLAMHERELAGAVVMLETGMAGYVPEHLLLFVAVDRELRGQGIGAMLLQAVKEKCTGGIALHVEPDNPAKRLYERAGFKNKYLEMRFSSE